jgi:hypothetical protein
MLWDPEGVRIQNSGETPFRLLFGPTDECRLQVNPPGTGPAGLAIVDPEGLRVINPSKDGAHTLLFGPTDECRLQVNQPGTGPGGVAIVDPAGLRLINPSEGGAPSLNFGPTNDCAIRTGVPGGISGLFFTDPNGFFFTNPAGANAKVTVEGELLAQEFIQTSTRRLKENIRPIEDPLGKIAQLQGVRYDWIAERGGEADLGFIAEEVGKVLPELVAWEQDGKNARGVNYGHLVAVAVEGIKAQQEEIETLRKEKADLERRLTRLEQIVLQQTPDNR